jgi:spore coat protein CotH
MTALRPFLALACLLGALTGATAQNLPILRIASEGGISPDAYKPCTAQLTETGQPAAASLKGQIKVRGSSSQAYDKKSFALKLDHAAALLDLPKNREWVLNAAFVDCSMMRHKLAYDLFRAMGTPTAPRIAPASRFIEIELNGRYHGLYLLMQPVDDLLVGFAPPKDSDATPAVIYKAVDHAANFGQPGHEGYDQRLPDPVKSPTWTPLDELNKFVSQASDRDFRDPQTGIASRLDLANAIDFHLLVLLTSNLDGITKNYNLARPAAAKGGPAPKFTFVPWDYDATFGRNWDGSRVDAKAWLSNRLFDRLLADPALRPRYAQRWQELRAKTFSADAILAQIDANAATIGDAALRNEKRWKQLDYANPRERTFVNDLAQMKRWVPQRLAWLDADLAQRTAR